MLDGGWGGKYLRAAQDSIAGLPAPEEVGVKLPTFLFP